VLGSLASRQRAAFPVIAALGGMVVPALLFLAFTWQDPWRARMGDPGRNGYRLCARRAGAAG
jgi:Na+/H+ antiporter NhaA